MGLLLIIVAINTKRKWLRNFCFGIPFIWSVIVVLRSGEHVLYAAFIQILAWILMFIIGYGIRLGIRSYRRRQKKH